MTQKLTCLQAYRVMLHCFDTIYFQRYNDDLGGMLSGAALYSVDEEPETMDPAVWHDWMDGVKIILNDQSITWNTTELTVDQAHAAARQYLVIYCDIGVFELIGVLLDLMLDDAQQPKLSQWLKNKWLQALDVVLSEKLPDNLGCLFNEKIELTPKKSIKIQQIEKIISIWFYNHDLPQIDLIVLSEVITVVQQMKGSYLLHDDEITVLDTYRIMLSLLELMNQEHSSEKITKKLDWFGLSNDGKPKHFLILIEWLYTIEQVTNNMV